MPNAPTWHPYHQSSYMASRLSFSIPPFSSFVDKLVESRVDVVGELYFSNGSHALRCKADGEADDTLF